jgi:hypothetical protein
MAYVAELGDDLIGGTVSAPAGPACTFQTRESRWFRSAAV